MSVLDGAKPGDVRGFVHKKIGGFIKGIGIGGVVDIVGGVKDFFGGGNGTPISTGACPGGRRPPTELEKATVLSQPVGSIGRAKQMDAYISRCIDMSAFTGPSFNGGGGGGRSCPSGTVWSSKAQACVSPRSPFGERMLGDFGECVAGRYGPGMFPTTVQRSTSMCEAGMVLGKDGLCYVKAALSNKFRLYPRGRRPLLTGGDMRALSKARTAANRYKRTGKDFRDLGLLPAPRARKASKSNGKVC